jgi:integrase
LADLRFHDLRHTYITMGAEGGVALDVMMRQVGHINPTQTRDYVHIGESAVSDAVEVIEKRFEQTS